MDFKAQAKKVKEKVKKAGSVGEKERALQELKRTFAKLNSSLRALTAKSSSQQATQIKASLDSFFTPTINETVLEVFKLRSLDWRMHKSVENVISVLLVVKDNLQQIRGFEAADLTVVADQLCKLGKLSDSWYLIYKKLGFIIDKTANWDLFGFM